MNWLYENDYNNTVRYVLGVAGNNPLICFGINPSTAEPNNLDNTLKSVERLSYSNGFDSWIMFNVYPQRSTNPNGMDIECNQEIHRKNLIWLEKILKTNKPTLWAAWGTIIEKRSYLKTCLIDMVNISSQYSCEWVTIGNISKAGHPHHPLYLSKIEKTKLFQIDSYINDLSLK